MNQIMSDGSILKQMMTEVKAVNVEKGWYEDNPKLLEFEEWMSQNGGVDLTIMEKLRELVGPRTFGDDIALLHSEVSEMLEAFRVGGVADQTKPLTVAKGQPTDPMALPKPEGVGAEAADVLIRLLDTCERYSIDLFAEWRRKVDYNRTRPARHGGKAL